MSLSDLEIAQVVAELAPELAGAGIGKVHETPGPTLIFEIGRERLLVSTHPRASRLCAVPARGRADKPSAAASAFAMLLRKRLGGLRLVALVAAPGERVVTLDFGPGQDRLVAELTGPHANVFLVDAAGLLVSSLRPSRSTTRPLAPGAAYEPPAPAPAEARWRGRDRFGAPPGVSARIAAHYDAQLLVERTTALREQLTAALRRAVDRYERRAEALEGDLARAEAADVYRKYGDLLFAHLHELPGRGAESVTLADDFEDGAPLTIALVTTLDGKGNAARYYKQHKRLAGGRQKIAARLLATRAATDEARAHLAAVAGLDLAGLGALAARLPAALRPAATADDATGGGSGGAGGISGRARARAARRGEDAPAPPYREFRSLAGDVILVGKSAADNDSLTFGHARGNDMWLHTRDAPGAHVIVRRPRGDNLAEATLLDAATLAAHYSPLGGEAQIDVSYTPVKNLRKPKGTAPGLVYVSEAKTIRVRMEPERLARLMGRE